MESFDSLGEFVDLDLLDHLGDAMLLNDKLLFLGLWCSDVGSGVSLTEGGSIALILHMQPSIESITHFMSERTWLRLVTFLCLCWCLRVFLNGNPPCPLQAAVCVCTCLSIVFCPHF